MQTITIDDEQYIKVNGTWVDGGFIIPPTRVLRKILQAELAQIDIDTLSMAQLKTLVDETRDAECFDMCLRLVEKLIQKSLDAGDDETAQAYISTKCSCLRNLNDPAGAIEFCKQVRTEYGDEMLSVATLTSLAAAYCDLEQWADARLTCNFAYKKQGGGMGYANELSKVYKRIDANGR